MTQDAGWGGGGAQGGAPYGGVPYGGPPAPPGWGGWTPPPKPGVIPLAPLKLGDVLNGAFSTMGRYWKQVLGMGAALYGGAALVMAAALAIAFSAVSGHVHRLVSLSSGEEAASADVVPVLTALGVLVLVGILAMAAASGLMYAAVPAVLQDAVLGRPVTFGTVWRRACARLPAMIGILIITGLISMVPAVLGLLTFVGVIAGISSTDGDPSGLTVAGLGALGILVTAPLSIWLWVKFSLAPTAAVFEGRGVFAALSRSSRLVRGDWWRIFGISVLVYIIAMAAGSMIQMPFSFIGMFPSMAGASSLGNDPTPAAVLAALGGYVVASLVGQMVSQIISTTLPQLVIGLLYVDRRIRTEDLGPVLAEAAQVPQPGAFPGTPPGPYPAA